jgi:hypothetical protein
MSKVITELDLTQFQLSSPEQELVRRAVRSAFKYEQTGQIPSQVAIKLDSLEHPDAVRQVLETYGVSTSYGAGKNDTHFFLRPVPVGCEQAVDVQGNLQSGFRKLEESEYQRVQRQAQELVDGSLDRLKAFKKGGGIVNPSQRKTPYKVAEYDANDPESVRRASDQIWEVLRREGSL